MTEMSTKDAKELKVLYKAKFEKKFNDLDLIKSLTASKLNGDFYSKFIGCYKNMQKEEKVEAFSNIFKPLK